MSGKNPNLPSKVSSFGRCSPRYVAQSKADPKVSRLVAIAQHSVVTPCRMGGITEGTAHKRSSLIAPQRPSTWYIVAYMTRIIHFIQTPTALHTEWEDIVEKIAVSCCLFPVRLSRSTANVSVQTWAHLHRVDKVMPSRCVMKEQIRLRLRPAEQFQKPLTKVHQSIKNENMYRTTSCQIFSLSTSFLHRLVEGKQHHNEKTQLDAGWHSFNRSLSHPKHRRKTCTYSTR